MLSDRYLGAGQRLVYLGLPGAGDRYPVLARAARGIRAGEVGAVVAIGLDEVVLGVVGAEGVEGNAGALAVGPVRAGRVRRAVAEERDAAGQLQVDGILLR